LTLVIVPTTTAVGRQSFAGLDGGADISRKRIAGLRRSWSER
jgi:hypothetical protein